MNKAHVTHPELKCTFCLEIIGVKKNPNGQTYTTLGVITKGTIIEVGFCAVIQCQHRLIGPLAWIQESKVLGKWVALCCLALAFVRPVAQVT